MFNGRTTNKFSELHGIEILYRGNIMDNEIKAAKMKKGNEIYCTMQKIEYLRFISNENHCIEIP